MKKYIVNIGQKLEITVDEKSDSITQNAKQSQYFVAALDGWTLVDGDELYVSFTNGEGAEDQNGPYQLLYNTELGGYAALIPESVVNSGGDWTYSVEHRFDVEATDDGTTASYYSTTSANYPISVKNSAAIAGNNLINEQDILNLSNAATAAQAAAADSAEEAAKSAAEIKSILGEYLENALKDYLAVHAEVFYLYGNSPTAQEIDIDFSVYNVRNLKDEAVESAIENFYLLSPNFNIYLCIPNEGGSTAKGYLITREPPFLKPSDVVDELTSTATSKPLSANSGRELKGMIAAIQTLLESDDTDLDTIQEIVNYIKSNKTLIESITTTKVNVSDIIDNLDSNISNKPLSAAQGYALKLLIEESGGGTEVTPETLGLATVATSGSYEDLSDKPSIPSAPDIPTPEAGDAGKTLIVGDDLTLGYGEAGSDYELPVAAVTVLGGIKAAAKTTADSIPCRIGTNGQLYVTGFAGAPSSPYGDTYSNASTHWSMTLYYLNGNKIDSVTQGPEYNFPSNVLYLKFNSIGTAGNSVMTATLLDMTSGNIVTLSEAGRATIQSSVTLNRLYMVIGTELSWGGN